MSQSSALLPIAQAAAAALVSDSFVQRLYATVAARWGLDEDQRVAVVGLGAEAVADTLAEGFGCVAQATGDELCADDWSHVMVLHPDLVGGPPVVRAERVAIVCGDWPRLVWRGEGLSVDAAMAAFRERLPVAELVPALGAATRQVGMRIADTIVQTAVLHSGGPRELDGLLAAWVRTLLADRPELVAASGLASNLASASRTDGYFFALPFYITLARAG